MALTARSLFLYGYEVTANNRSIDFRAVALETPRQATLNLGFYSSTSLATEIARAMAAVDATRTYTVTINRNVAGGLENRVTISTSGGHLELLFSSGPRAASTVAPLIGFNSSDYTGSTTYTGSSSTGTVFSPTQIGYTFLSPDFYRKIFGAVNVSASGLKEVIAFQTQKFWQVEFKHEPYSTVVNNWTALMTWMIQGRLIEFTPEITSPTVFYEGTLESTPQDGKALAYTFPEMLAEGWINYYRTGILTFRVNAT